jgi:hypothetical protein
MRRCVLVACLLGAGCNDRPLPGDESTGSSGAAPTTGASGATPTSSSGEAPTTGDATTGSPALCQCSAFTEAPGECDVDDDLWTQIPDCTFATICERVTVECPRPGADLYDCQDELVIAEDALTCALTAMRDRTPGRFIIEGTAGGNHGYHETHGMRLRGDDTVVISECIGAIGGSVSAFEGTLALPAYFADCLAMVEPKLRHICLLDGLTTKTSLPACGDE